MRAVWMLGLLVAGCTSAPPAPVSPAPPRLPEFTTTTAAPPTRAERAVPRTCGRVITKAELEDLLQTAISGGTAEVTGKPMPGIGRTARLDCYFGIPGGDRDAATVVVTLASYRDAALAQARIDRTIADEQAQGASVSEVAVGPDSGYLIEGTARIVVVAHGRMTVVVQVVPLLVPGSQAGQVLPRIADRALTER